MLDFFLKNYPQNKFHNGNAMYFCFSMDFILLQLEFSSEIVMHVAVASSLGVICFTSISSIRSHIKLKT